MLIYNGQIIAGGGTIVLPMTRAEYEANKAILDSADVWVDLTDEPDQVATAEQIAYSVDNVQKSMGYIGDIATKAIAKVEPTDTALYLHEVGEYFINKDGDACKVDLQIPVNGTITLGTNCHILSKGVANDINNNLSDLTDIVTNNTQIATLADGVEQNFVATDSGYIQLISDGTLPAGTVRAQIALKIPGFGNVVGAMVATNANNYYARAMLYVRKGQPFGVVITGASGRCYFCKASN